MVYFYILKSKNYPKTYVGISDNVERRMVEHNNGLSLFTSRYLPWGVIYREECVNKNEARKREKYFKSAAGRRKIKVIVKNNIPG